MDDKVVPSERMTTIGEEVGTTSIKHLESARRKKVEFAPESDMTKQEEGVARDVEDSILVELHTTISLDDISPTTLTTYLGRIYFEVFPPVGLVAVAAAT